MKKNLNSQYVAPVVHYFSVSLQEGYAMSTTGVSAQDALLLQDDEFWY